METEILPCGTVPQGRIFIEKEDVPPYNRYCKKYGGRETVIIRNGLVFQENGTYRKQDLYIEKGRIVSSSREVTDGQEMDAGGLKILPGLIDVHSHGAAGCDFSDGSLKGLEKILRYQKSCGVTTYCPTTMTLPEEKLLQALSSVNAVQKEKDQAVIAGIHMEGPFLDPARKGAHRADSLRCPDVEFFQRCQEACGGRIRLLTMAPNLAGAKELIRDVCGETVVSLGHTDADYDCASRAFDLGAAHVTHLYNAMAPFGHRCPGLVGAAFDYRQVMVELIADGIHVHPCVVRSTFSLFGRDRVVLISDSIAAAGMEDGVCLLSGQKVTVKDGKATLSDGTIAGCAVSLFTCMKRAIRFGVPEGDAVLAATANPARSIGIYDETGSLSPGKRADLLVTDQDLNLLQVL